MCKGIFFKLRLCFYGIQNTQLDFALYVNYSYIIRPPQASSIEILISNQERKKTSISAGENVIKHSSVKLTYPFYQRRWILSESQKIQRKRGTKERDYTCGERSRKFFCQISRVSPLVLSGSLLLRVLTFSRGRQSPILDFWQVPNFLLNFVFLNGVFRTTTYKDRKSGHSQENRLTKI